MDYIINYKLERNYLDINDMHEDRINLVKLEKQDIVRHKIVSKIIDLYKR